jgi:small nuclear ribonucleoprotein (snRNP)-like protein
MPTIFSPTKDKERMRLRIFIILTLTLFCLQSVFAGSKRALLIGLSDYPKYKQTQLDWHNIHGANDVALIGGTLKKQGFTVTTLTNKQATAQAVRKAFARLAKQTKAGDLIYVHFSGHGQPFEDRNGDEADGWDESLVPYNAGQRYVANVYDGRNHIIDDELNVYITNIRKKAGVRGFVYVVLDACHMGGASRGDEDDEDSVYVRGSNVGFSRSGKVFMPRIDTRPVIKVPVGKNMAPTCYLEACRSYQANVEIKEGKQYYGPLSYYINKALSHNKLNTNTAWIDNVRKLMNADRRLVKQNMVVERSK